MFGKSDPLKGLLDEQSIRNLIARFADSATALNLYLPKTAATSTLIDTPATSLPGPVARSPLPRYLVHIHGGAWRDPEFTAESIEPTVAHVFSELDPSSAITAVAAINYRISPFPQHPTLAYDATIDGHSDPAREAVHPQRLEDVLRAFAVLRPARPGSTQWWLPRAYEREKRRASCFSTKAPRINWFR